MGWTAKEIDELRKGKNGTAGSTAGSSSAHSSTAAGSRSTGTGSGWTPEKIDALRGGSTGKRTTEAWENRSAGTSTETRRARTNTGSSQSSTGGSLGGQVLAQMMGSTNPKLQLEVPGSGTQSERNGTRGGTAQPEWLGKVGSSTPAAQVRGTVKPTEKKRQPYAATGGAMQLQSGYGAVNSAPNADALKQTIAAGDGKRVDWYARTAQEAKEDFAKNSEPDRFDELNQWMDADPKHRELVNLIRGGTGEQQPYVQRGNAMQAQDGTGAMASAPTTQSTGKRDYTDAELQAKGYTQTEINEAKAYIRDFDALPAWQRAVRRTSNTIGGIAEEIAAGGLQMGENAVQAVKNSSVTKKNRDALKESLAGDARQEKLFKLVDTVDSNGSPKYSDAELIAKGYTQGEIDDMRSRYAATEVKDAVDPEKSVGYQLHKRSQDLTGVAMSGLSPLAQKALGIVSSAGENLVVASIDPAMVLPVLSLQGAGESMGQSVEKGDSAGKTLAGGALKFGAGWAINSVGAADLAKTMGTDYARDTLAGKLADLVRSVADNGPLAQQYPVIANAVSGGVDNAMQAFVETYADMAIDAALGDSDAAQNLFKKDTFLNAVESGLTGGASGALGGAVGTGLGKMNARFDAAAGGPLSPLQSGDAGAATELSRGESLSQRNAEQEESAHAASPHQSPSATASPEGEALSPADMQAQQAAQEAMGAQSTASAVRSENQAVQQLAAAMADGELTGKTINLFTPNAANEANRAAFAEEYGMELPETAAKTRQTLRKLAAQQQSTQVAPAETTAANEEKPAGIAEAAAAESPAQLEESGQGYSVSLSNDTMTVRFADGTEAVQKVDLEDPKTLLFDPEQLHRQAQAESPAAQQTAVENTGETVESSPAKQPGGLRETYGLTQQSRSVQQRQVQQELTRWRVSDAASETISKNMPVGIGDAERYAAAASSLYRLGQMEDVTTFDKAMELAQGMSGLAVNTEYVLAQDGGRQALQLAWLQGHGEMEAGSMQRGTLGGELTEKSTSGSGRVLYKGTMRTANDVGTQLIELNARATDTDAVLKTVLQGNDRVKAYVDTEVAQIYFADSAEDVFGTILHEDYHWYNSLDAEGAQALQQHALEFLAKSEGYENIDAMIREKAADYAQQGLTYEQAAEELVADAWRGIFSDEASFKHWVEFQRQQAEKNAGRAGTIRKVMNKVKELLNDIVSRAKEVLAKDPENKAALRAQRLAEAEKRVLQDEYFAHADKAMDNLRAAKENAAALENKGAAEGTRYSINPEYAEKIDEWDKDGRSDDEVFILGRTGDTLQQLGARENDIYMNSDKINRILRDHPEMTLEEIKRIPEVLDNPVMVLTSQNKGRSRQNTRLVMFGSVKAQDGRPVLCVLDLRPVENHIVLNDMQKVTSAYTKDNDPVGFVRKSDVLYISESKEKTTELFRTLGFQMPSELQSSGLMGSITYGNQDVKLEGVKFTELENIKPSGGTHVESEDSRSRLPESFSQQESADTVLKTEEGGERPGFPADTSIAQEAAENKENDGSPKKNVRFQLAEQASRDAKKNDQQTASRAIADKAAALDTLSQFFGLTRGVKVSQSNIEGLASRWAKANGSKVDRVKLARETEVLVEYLKADGADMEKGQALAETLAGEILDGATYRNSELWDEYPELHKLEYTVSKTGQAKAELVKAYGSWSAAVTEARKHGVSLRQAEGVRDGNPAEQYESVINDNRAADGTSDGAKALWKAAAQQAGVDGAMSMESTEWLSVLMNLHDAIKPATQSRFADDAEYEDAKVELAGRIIGDILNTPEMTDAQAIFEGIQRHNLQVAQAAAGSEERAAEVTKGLKDVQKAQQREFNRRMYENRRAANQSAEVQQMTELQRQNAQAEKLLDENLETLGVDTSNVGNLNEKLTFLRESYEREMKQEVKRMKAERQEMLDEAKLEMQKLRSEKNELAWQLRQEKQRADKAEYSLLVQENEIMEWEADNERKRAAFEQKQAQRNAVAIETARQQRDEDIAIAKAVAEKRVQRARDARKMDELKRSIRQNAAQLNQMLLRPSKDKYVQKNLVDAAAQVAKLADMTILNNKAVNQLTRLQDQIRQSAGSENSPNAMTEEWKQTGVDTLIQTLRDDLQATKDAKLTRLHEQLAEAEALPDSEKARALQERLRKRIKETENRTYLPMTVDQMRMLKAITSSTLHVIKNANKTLSLAKAEEVSKIAEGAASEVQQSKGNHPGGKLDGVRNLLTKYQLDMLGGQRVFRMLGGYAKNGQMEKMANMLNDGQYRQTKITVEGEKLFANVTGKEHVKEMQAFAGPGADLVDVGLTDGKGNRAPLTHAQLCSLYMHLQNKDSIEHLMNGGFVIPDAKLYSKGDIEQAYQKGQTVHLGMLTNADGTPTADSILQTVEAAMSDYDRAWCADMKEFFDHYTTNLINETSLQLVGYQRATVKNYYPIAVDRSVLATQIEGLNLDATIEGRGFLKNRVKSSQPILLEECSSVVQRSLRDTADYAGLAAPIRDVQKILNSGVETREGLKNLKNGIIKEQWGGDAVNYIDNLLKDLQKKSRQRKSTLQWLGNLSSKYAGAVLTLNPGVALAQAASLPTAAAVLGGDTMAAVVPFVKNASPKQRAALEAEIKAHGDVLLDWRKRGSQNGELASIGKQKTLAEKGMDKLPNWLTGWINGMDEVTVAALWEGSKRYVQNHTAEFEGAEVTGSPAYWEAVNRTYQKVIEQTQPNYTVMQRAGIQRNPDGMAKALTMFTTQRFQNYGILADAVGDYKAQAERYRAESSAENKAEVQRAGQQLRRAVASQTVQTVTFALMKMSVGFVLHRWKDLQDENGDMTLKSLLKRLGELCMESFAGTGLYGSEIYGFASNAVTGNDYDVVSAANLGLVNEFAAAAGKFAYELRKDIGGMDEDEAEKHDRKLWTLAGNVVEAGLQALGVPYANGKKFVEAAAGWYGTLQDWKKNGKYGNFDSLPQSATGQYDRLYNAYASGDSDEAKAAVEKLNEMGKGEDVYKQLKTRLVKYDANVKAAAEAQNAGDDQKRYELEKEMIEQMSDALGLPKGKRGDVVDCVTGAVNQLADKLLKGDNSSATDDLVEAVDSWDASAVQEEYDRLAKAGKSATTLKSKITETAKPEYLAGSEADRQQMETMLLALEDADGKALYTEKTFAQWVKAADKAESEEKKDPYAAVR